MNNCYCHIFLYINFLIKFVLILLRSTRFIKKKELDNIVIWQERGPKHSKKRPNLAFAYILSIIIYKETYHLDLYLWFMLFWQSCKLRFCANSKSLTHKIQKAFPQVDQRITSSQSRWCNTIKTVRYQLLAIKKWVTNTPVKPIKPIKPDHVAEARKLKDCRENQSLVFKCAKPKIKQRRKEIKTSLLT